VIVRLAVYIVAACVAALLLGTISEQRLVSYESRTALFVFAGILGLLNAIIKPVLQTLALPLTCLTFGLAALIVNAGLFALATALTPGMRVTVAGAAFGAVLTSLSSGVIFSLIDEFRAARPADHGRA
jgi:putative membrane protein